MLKSLKKTPLKEVTTTHVDIFLEFYDSLTRWALRFTKHDRDQAEDLLHDVFIHLTLTRPKLEAVENLESYLYIVMRNLHLSQLRKSTRMQFRSLSVAGYDTVDVGLWASDPRDRLRLRDDLSAVCDYACIRKETSRVGSILILRFFHGYYPEEIAAVLRSSRSAIDNRLVSARSEARAYLEAPDRVSFIGQKENNAIKHHPLGADLRLEFRRQIFSTCRGECQSPEFLKKLYAPEADTIPTPLAAHIVSCPTCIENVNTVLGLPPLASRYPLDTLGKDPGPGDRTGGGGGGAGGGGPKMLDSYYYRRETYFHHEPRELCISVNGHLQGAHKVAADKNEMTLVIDSGEELGFVEIFSEQGLRLLLLNVERPPEGDGEQNAIVELSDGRTLSADLNFSGTAPVLQVSYTDPKLATQTAVEITAAPNESTGTPLNEIVSTVKPDKAGPFKIFSALRGKWTTWLQPARLTAGFAMLLIAALIWLKLGPTATVSAAELLTRSAEAEDARLANPERVLHRTIDLEELDSNGQVTNRKRIDIWQSADKGITARRLYDEQGRLAVGDWRSASGVQTIYRRGEPAKLQPLPERRQVSLDDAWQLSLTAREFIALVEENAATMEERANEYVISYSPPQTAGQILRATITLSKEDLHAIAQTFTLRNNAETHDFRMVEAAYDWRPANAVAPNVFEPNVELMSEPGAVATGFPGTQPVAKTDTTTNTNTETANTNTAAPAATLATAALEVEVIEALNNAGAFTGEQVDVSRTGDGKIGVTALVETANRKQALLTALNNLKNNPAVRIRIETVAEAEARIKKQTKGTTNAPPGTVEKFDADVNANPIYAELRKKFSEEEARRFVGRVLNRAGQARSHALAMKQLSGRFSQADLASLTTMERGRWLALVRGHAERFVAESEALRRDLQQFFPEAAAGAGGGGAVGSDTELQARARELYDASVAIDRGLNRSLALTAGPSGTGGGAPLGPAFWRQFASAVSMAKSLAAAK